jgi:hypothetical protein
MAQAPRKSISHTLEAAPRVEDPVAAAPEPDTAPPMPTTQELAEANHKDHLRPLACFATETVDAPFDDGLTLEDERTRGSVMGKILIAALVMAVASGSALWAAGVLTLPQ